MAQFIDQPAEADGPIIEFIKVSTYFLTCHVREPTYGKTVFLVFEQINHARQLMFPFSQKKHKRSK
jgi:hypothetical protein